jgi:hypothetical protein
LRRRGTEVSSRRSFFKFLFTGDDSMTLIRQARILCGILIFASAVPLWADETKELVERATGMKKEAAMLAEKGHVDEAEKLERAAKELMQQAERAEMKKAEVKKAEMKKKEQPKAEGVEKKERENLGGNLKERLQDLLAKEREMSESGAPPEALEKIRGMIAQAERQVNEIRQRGEQSGWGGKRGIPEELQEQAKKIEMSMRRVRHLRVAAENLKMAEMHDMAMELMKRAEAMERETVAQKERIADEFGMRGGKPRMEELPAAMRELREENERLRAELNELRKK